MIELLVNGKLAIETEGQLELPKQPPFDVLTPGWAVQRRSSSAMATPTWSACSMPGTSGAGRSTSAPATGTGSGSGRLCNASLWTVNAGCK